jgi:hypothetical protein
LQVLASVAPTVVEYLPASQLVQVVAAAEEYLPASQMVTFEHVPSLKFCREVLETESAVTIGVNPDALDILSPAKKS